jgi:hypothetical protein
VQAVITPTVCLDADLSGFQERSDGRSGSAVGQIRNIPIGCYSPDIHVLRVGNPNGERQCIPHCDVLQQKVMNPQKLQSASPRTVRLSNALHLQVRRPGRWNGLVEPITVEDAILNSNILIDHLACSSIRISKNCPGGAVFQE